MPDGTDAPKVYWSNIPEEIVKDAPLSSLLFWCSVAEQRYQLPVPSDYPRLPENKIKDWIIEQIHDEIENAGGGKPANIERIQKEMSDAKKQSELEDKFAKHCTKFELSEMGNAERLIYRYGENLKYCKIFGSWYIWNGDYWREDDTDEIIRLAKKTVRKIPREAEFTENDEKFRQVMKHALICESNAKIRSMVALAESEVAVTPKVFDSSGLLFNCQNGTYELGCNYFREHRKEDLLSMMSGVTFDPEAKCPKWIDHLLLVFNQNYELLRSFQEMCGYSLLLDNPDQLIFLLHGDGKNGKSVTVKTISAMMGDYAKNVSPETLMVRKYTESPRSDIARLVGSRVITCTEGEEGQQFAESLVKQLTGGDKITVRRLFEKEFEFEPTFKIWFATNHKPKIRGTDTAIWRRIWLIPFTYTIPEEKRDNEISKKLLGELPGIFNWCIEGLIRYQKRGHLAPASEVIMATNEYRKESNTLEEFFIDACSFPEPGHIGVEYFVGAAELYIAYKNYAHANGDDPISQTAFGKIMKTRDGVTITRDSHGKRYIGVRLKY